MAATLIDPGISLEVAIGRGYDVYDVLINGWGTADTDVYPGITLPVTFPRSVAGVCIGPQSDVDRAWISWNTGLFLPGNTAAQEVAAQTAMFQLSKDSPLLFTTLGNIGGGNGTGLALNVPATAPTNAMRLGLFTVFPKVPYTDRSSAFVAIEVAQGRQLNTLLPAIVRKPDGTDQVFTDYYPATGLAKTYMPKLHLQFLLKPGLQLPTKRAPAHYLGSGGVTVPGTEELIMYFPTFGRKSISIIAFSDTVAAATDVRIGGFMCTYDTGAPVMAFEATLDTKTIAMAVGPGTSGSTRFQFTNPGVDYIGVYGNNAAGAGVVFTAVLDD